MNGTRYRFLVFRAGGKPSVAAEAVLARPLAGQPLPLLLEFAKVVQRAYPGAGVRVQDVRGKANPTLVHHGLARRALWHVTGTDGRALADLYFGETVTARAMAQVIATLTGRQVRVYENTRMGTPPLSRHVSFTAGRRVSNPGPEPAFGQVWPRRGGGRSRVLAVTPTHVDTLDLDTGNRERIERVEFMATHRAPAKRNPTFRVSGTIRVRGAGKRARGVTRTRKRGAHSAPAPANVVPMPRAPRAPRARAPREFKPGDRVTVPYSGRASYFGRAVKRTSESATVLTMVPAEAGGEPGVMVSVRRGKGVEQHTFPLHAVRRKPSRIRQPLHVREAKKIARLERKYTGRDEALSEAIEKAEKRREQLYDQVGGLMHTARDQEHRELDRARAAYGRALREIDVLHYVANKLAGPEPWAVGNPSRSKRARAKRKADRAAGGRRVYRTAVAARRASPEAFPGAFVRHQQAALSHGRRSRARASRTTNRRRHNPGADYTIVKAFPNATHDHPNPWAVLDFSGRVVQSAPSKDVAEDIVRVLRSRMAQQQANRRRPNPGSSGERARAERMFETWHEFGSKAVKRVRVPSRTLPRYGVKLGEIVTLDYVSDKWEGKPVTYTHDTKRPRPWLVSDPDGQQLFIVGGRMKPTADGLVN